MSAGALVPRAYSGEESVVGGGDRWFSHPWHQVPTRFAEWAAQNFLGGGRGNGTPAWRRPMHIWSRKRGDQRAASHVGCVSQNGGLRASECGKLEGTCDVPRPCMARSDIFRSRQQRHRGKEGVGFLLVAKSDDPCTPLLKRLPAAGAPCNAKRRRVESHHYRLTLPSLPAKASPTWRLRREH
jgi:hypothetical protein